MSGSPFAEVKHLPVNPVMREYLIRSCTPPDPEMSELIEQTASVGESAGMMVPVEQAALLTMLVKLLSATKVIDVGTFTGVSALALARGLSPGGTVITCDVTDQWVGIAREHWDRAGVADRIEFRLGPAGRTLADLSSEEPIDLVFIDADKMNYPNYYRAAVPMLRTGGLLVADNVLLDGYVIDPDLASPGLARRSAQALRTFNSLLADDERLDTVMLPIADGLTIARKR